MRTKKIVPKTKQRGRNRPTCAIMNTSHRQVDPEVAPPKIQSKAIQRGQTPSFNKPAHEKPTLPRRPRRPAPPGETSSRVPSVKKRIPAFKGTAGMLWEDALDYIIAEDAGRAEMEKSSMRRDAIRGSWVGKMIQKLDEDYEKEQMKTMVSHLVENQVLFSLVVVFGQSNV